MGFFSDLLMDAGKALVDKAMQSADNAVQSSETRTAFIDDLDEVCEEEEEVKECREDLKVLLTTWDGIFQKDGLIVDPKKCRATQTLPREVSARITEYFNVFDETERGYTYALERFEDDNATLDVWTLYVDSCGKKTNESHAENSYHFIRYYPNKDDEDTYLVFSFYPNLTEDNILCCLLSLEFKSNDKDVHTKVMISNPNSRFNYNSGVYEKCEFVSLKRLFKIAGGESIYEHLCNFIHHPYSLTEAERTRREEEARMIEKTRLAEIERQKKIEEEQKKMAEEKRNAERGAVLGLLNNL